MVRVSIPPTSTRYSPQPAWDTHLGPGRNASTPTGSTRGVPGRDWDYQNVGLSWTRGTRSVTSTSRLDKIGTLLVVRPPLPLCTEFSFAAVQPAVVSRDGALVSLTPTLPSADDNSCNTLISVLISSDSIALSSFQTTLNCIINVYKIELRVSRNFKTIKIAYETPVLYYNRNSL